MEICWILILYKAKGGVINHWSCFSWQMLLICLFRPWFILFTYQIYGGLQRVHRPHLMPIILDKFCTTPGPLSEDISSGSLSMSIISLNNTFTTFPTLLVWHRKASGRPEKCEQLQISACQYSPVVKPLSTPLAGGFFWFFFLLFLAEILHF